jgi:hypothetical protein
MLKPWWEQPDAHDRAVKFHNRLQVLGTAAGLGLAGYGVYKLNQRMKKPPQMYIDWRRLSADEERNLLENGPGKTGSARIDKERELYRTHGVKYRDYLDQVEAIEHGTPSVYTQEEMDAYRTLEKPQTE